MTRSSLTFTDDFPQGDESAWAELVEKALKGKKTESLNSLTEHGIEVQALYAPGRTDHQSPAPGLPGMRPFARGTSATRDQWLPWDIRQMVRRPDPAAAREEVFENLTNGASSIELRVDVDGENGVCIDRSDSLAGLLEGVDVELATVSFDLVGTGVGHERELAAMAAASFPETVRARARLAFNLDPVGAFARTGSAFGAVVEDLGATAADAYELHALYPAAQLLRADARVVHEAGGTEVQELAYLAATTATYMRACIEAGLAANVASTRILHTLAVGSDYHLETAKIRAARKLVGRIADAFGAKEIGALHAVTSRRMLSARDPWNNLLRNTAACFAAGIAGADVVTVRTFTDALGHAAPLARRLARNTQLIAQEESGLGNVIDPAGGSWAFEKVSDEMAEAAWKLFQEIEKEGGILPSLMAGRFQSGVADARQARRTAIARRREWVTGVSDFPQIEDETPDLIEAAAMETPTAGNVHARFPETAGPFSEVLEAARAGASLREAALAEPNGDECEPMWPIRLSEPFEALRDVADRRRDQGKPPKVFLAALGPLAEHSARLTYATNFFAAGGIEAIVAAGDAETLAADFTKSSCQITCICGSDDRYAEEAAAAAAALRNAGAGRIYLAGKPGADVEDLRAAGIDEFIHIGVDVIASLELAHAELGLGGGGR